MKPYLHVRKARGYCCDRCDGPYAKWKKIVKRSAKRTDKNLAKKQMTKDMSDE